jgi:ABC-type branched-subunit amino acid transport system ATPase component
MTAVENLLVAQHRHLNTNFISAAANTRVCQSELRHNSYAAVADQSS